MMENKQYEIEEVNPNENLPSYREIQELSIVVVDPLGRGLDASPPLSPHLPLPLQPPISALPPPPPRPRWRVVTKHLLFQTAWIYTLNIMIALFCCGLGMIVGGAVAIKHTWPNVKDYPALAALVILSYLFNVFLFIISACFNTHVNSGIFFPKVTYIILGICLGALAVNLPIIILAIHWNINLGYFWILVMYGLWPVVAALGTGCLTQPSYCWRPKVPTCIVMDPPVEGMQCDFCHDFFFDSKQILFYYTPCGHFTHVCCKERVMGEDESLLNNECCPLHLTPYPVVPPAPPLSRRQRENNAKVTQLVQINPTQELEEVPVGPGD